MNWSISSGELMSKAGTQPSVDGRPTHELASRKDDLSVMLKCCDAEEANYWSQQSGSRICAAPFFFERAAILLAKQKRFTDEVSICDRWASIAEDYSAQKAVMSGLMAKIHLGPRPAAIAARRQKAAKKIPHF
ncbi:hypothetical protein [Pseudomonas putida]|uniref:hypothetical protein n=1 Tax=Pseudomonas putida TaxID=303 RepID=UPI003463841A